jgi:hypothetical protein
VQRDGGMDERVLAGVYCCNLDYSVTNKYKLTSLLHSNNLKLCKAQYLAHALIGASNELYRAQCRVL